MLKKILLGSIVAIGLGSIANEACADASAPYIGGQLGIASHNYKTGDLVKNGNGSVDNNFLAGRIYGGYDFDEHLGLQLGYTYFGKPNFKSTSGSEESFSQYGLDLSGLFSINFNPSLGAFIKGGLVWIHRGSAANNATFNGLNSNSKLSFLGGLGLTYAFTNNLSTDLSWTHILSCGDLPKTDFFALGLKYRFGDN